MTDESNKTYDKSTMPFAAPCRTLSPFAAFRWLRLGVMDYQHAPRQSLAYGIFMAAIMASLLLGAWFYGSIWFMLAMLGGFVFLAPLSCIGLYAISAQLERGQPPSLKRSLRAAFRRHFGNEMVFAIVLLVIFLVWARAGAMVSVFFPTVGHPDIAELRGYLAVGSLVGAVFAAVTFSASAFSLPMIMHRDVDSVTAIVTSINAVLRNKFAMMLWLAIIVAGLIIGAATAFIGMVFILPVIGYAAWHGYLETIDASAFPRHRVGITATPIGDAARSADSRKQ
ncbi:MAG: DUF2189 domain-containing protein [Woeseia sp.]